MHALQSIVNMNICKMFTCSHFPYCSNIQDKITIFDIQNKLDLQWTLEVQYVEVTNTV